MKVVGSIEGISFIQLIAGEAWESGQFAPSLHDLAERLKRRENFSNVLVQVQIDGGRRWWELSGTPMLDEKGVFRGGLILPGIDLMLHALADNTAGLRTPPGSFREYPATTADALFSGAVQAASGAIEQMRRRVRGHGPEVTCYLAGGSAPDVAPHLAAPVEVVEHLVLEGVLVLALLSR